MNAWVDTANLAIAAMDLLLVRDLIGAMRAADAEVAAFEGSRTSSLSPIAGPAQVSHVSQDYVYETRRVIHLPPCYEAPRPAPQPFLHALPRLALESVERVDCPAICGATLCHASKPVLQPPWATLPWQEPAKPPAQVKVVMYRTDTVSKGTLVDMFA